MIMRFYYANQAKWTAKNCTVDFLLVPKASMQWQELAREMDTQQCLENTSAANKRPSETSTKTFGHHCIPYLGVQLVYCLNLQMKCAPRNMGHRYLKHTTMSRREQMFVCVWQDEIDVAQRSRALYCYCASFDNVEMTARTTKKSVSSSARRLFANSLFNELHSRTTRTRHQSTDHKRIMPSTKAPCMYVFLCKHYITAAMNDTSCSVEMHSAHRYINQGEREKAECVVTSAQATAYCLHPRYKNHLMTIITTFLL